MARQAAQQALGLRRKALRAIHMHPPAVPLALPVRLAIRTTPPAAHQVPEVAAKVREAIRMHQTALLLILKVIRTVSKILAHLKGAGLLKLNQDQTLTVNRKVVYPVTPMNTPLRIRYIQIMIHTRQRTHKNELL